MPHSEESLAETGTDISIYSNFLRELMGDEIAEVDSFEAEGVLEAEFYLPGFKQKDITSRLSGRVLKIRARKKDESGKVIRGYCCYRLPDDVDKESVDIRHSDYLVEVVMVKKDELILT